jgi:hypothetical protein
MLWYSLGVSISSLPPQHETLSHGVHLKPSSKYRGPSLKQRVPSLTEAPARLFAQNRRQENVSKRAAPRRRRRT